MKFPYQKYPASPNPAFPERKKVLRPVIPLTLIARDGKTYRYDTLIDSGADHNMFHAEIGEEIIGLNVKSGESIEFFGVTGEKQKAFFHHIEVEVGGHRHKIYCGFVYDFKNLTYGILGQDDFFKFYAIEFDLSKERIELKPGYRVSQKGTRQKQKGTQKAKGKRGPKGKRQKGTVLFEPGKG